MSKAVNEVIERLARMAAGSPDAWYDDEDFWRAAVRRVLEALQTPTEAMVVAALQSSLTIMREAGTDRLMPDAEFPAPSEVAKKAFGAIIDAALTP